MNIVIYTSLTRSSFDEYNITQLLAGRPQHNYSFVILNTRPRQVSLLNKFKRLIVSLRDGANELQKDLKTLDELIYKKCTGFNLKDYDTHYVEAVNGEKTEDIIRGLNPDIIVQAGAGILKKNIFSIASKGTLNVHHGLAPEIRGIKSTFWCLYYGLTDLIGVTCHLIDENLDTGNIISQHKYEYQPGDSYVKIQESLCIEGAKLLLHSVDALENYSSLNYKETEVKSFYFGSVNYPDYNALKKGKFSPVKDNERASLKTKKKIKKVLIPEN